MSRSQFAVHRGTLTLTVPLDKSTLDPAKFVIDPDPRIIRTVPKEHWKIEGDQLVEMTPAEKAAADAGMLPQLKIKKVKAIDVRTRQLIDDGFDYDGRHFSMSDKAQLTWNSIIAEGQSGTLTLPIEVSTDDVNSVYALTDAHSVREFFRTYRQTLRQRLQSGLDLKKLVRDAATKAELDGIVDPR